MGLASCTMVHVPYYRIIILVSRKACSGAPGPGEPELERAVSSSRFSSADDRSMAKPSHDQEDMQ